MRFDTASNMQQPSDSDNTIKIGISSCLMGNEVRFDKGHKKQRYITDVMSRFFKFQTVCPEVAIGLGIPRPVIRLLETGDKKNEIRLVNSGDYSIDHTDKMKQFSKTYCDDSVDQLSGFILKNNSPSCGMERVKIYNAETGMPRNNPGSGLFAHTLMKHHPDLPVEEEGRLNDDALRDNFLMRIYVYHAWQALIKQGITPAKLVEFHSRQKYLLMTHDQEQAKLIGQLVAKAGLKPIETLAAEYIYLLMQVLRTPGNRKRHTNTLMHLMGYLREPLDRIDRKELLERINAYREGKIPLNVPMTLLKHHFNRHPNPYIDIQTYLAPYPIELNPESTFNV